VPATYKQSESITNVTEVYIKQEAQVMLTNPPHDAFRGQSRSPIMAPFDMLGMVSY